MARELDHIELANRNHDALLLLMEHAEQHPEWVVIVAFYKAVQIVEAALANHRGYDSNSHDRRIEQLKRPEFKEIFRAYRPLFGASLIARYLEDSTPGRLYDKSHRVVKYHKFTDHTPADRVIDRFVRRRLAAIEQHAVRFLSEEGRAKLKRICHHLDSHPTPPAE